MPAKTSENARLTLVFSLTALILYFPANILPFMTLELYGNRNSSTVWGGIVSLAEGGSLVIAIIIFLASIFVPLLKLLILFYLSLTAHRDGRAQLKNRLHYVIEVIGRWSMLDIFLLAVLVAMMKFGKWTTVEPELGAVMFALVVIFTMLASACFKPPLLKNESKTHDRPS